MSQPTTERRFIREPARRVFAAELRECRLQFKDGDDEKSPSFVLLPTGERSNRMFLCGEMTKKEKRGDQTQFYTARVQDPTGIFFINAGSYQPEAMQELAQIEPPSYVAVVGKPSIRETPDGSVFVSVRVESVTEIDREAYETWVLDTARQTLDRIDEFGKTDDSDKAQKFYNTDLIIHRQMAYEALTSIEL